jgi:DNA-directed RNA polymerase specialized sigma24 family protein
MAIPDGDLVRLARDGDPAAFRLLVERHLPMARARAARLCPRPDDADDAVQDAFLQAFIALDRLRDPDRFAGWLGGIVANVCRAQRRRPPLTLLGDWPENLHPASAHGLPSAEDLDRAEALGRGRRPASRAAPRRHPVLLRRPGPPTRSLALPAPQRPACTRPATDCASTSPRTAPTSSPPPPGGRP